MEARHDLSRPDPPNDNLLGEAGPLLPPGRLRRGQIPGLDVVLHLIHLVFSLVASCPHCELGAVLPLEQVFVKVHEHVHRRADVDVHVAVEKLGQAGHVGSYPAVLLSIAAVKDTTVGVDLRGWS
jgi:hypothetical protein